MPKINGLKTYTLRPDSLYDVELEKKKLKKVLVEVESELQLKLQKKGPEAPLMTSVDIGLKKTKKTKAENFTAYLNCFKIDNEFFVIPLRNDIMTQAVGKTLRNLEILDSDNKVLPFKISIPSKTPPEKIIDIIKKAKSAHELKEAKIAHKNDVAETAEKLGLKTDTLLEFEAYYKKLDAISSNPKSIMQQFQRVNNNYNLVLTRDFLNLINDKKLSPEEKLIGANKLKDIIKKQPFSQKSFALQNHVEKIANGLQEKTNSETER